MNNNPYEYWLARDAAVAAEGVDFPMTNVEVAFVAGFFAVSLMVIPVIAFFVS